MPKPNIALITGASSGLGRSFVRLVLCENDIEEIWAVARTQSKLNDLRQEFGNKIKPYSTDLSDYDQIIKLKDIIDTQKPNIKYLINCAGFAKFCSYSDLSVKESLNMINLNCGGIVSMCSVCLPFMARGSHIINISSQSAFQPLPYLNIYSSTKVFVHNYSRALNVELKSRDISVTAACPGWIDTALFDRAEIGAKKAPSVFLAMAKPDKVAKKIFKDAKKKKDLSVYGYYVKVCRLAAKLLPQKIMMKLWLAQQHIKPY